MSTQITSKPLKCLKCSQKLNKPNKYNRADNAADNAATEAERKIACSDVSLYYANTNLVLFFKELKGAFTLTVIKMLEVAELLVLTGRSYCRGTVCVPIGRCPVLSLLVCIKLSS